MPRSVRMRASTGKAVTDMDTPRNNENAVNDTLLFERYGYRRSDRLAPKRNGTTILAWEIVMVERARSRSRVRASSSPTRNMYRMTPNCEITLSKGAIDCGNMYAAKPGANLP